MIKRMERAAQNVGKTIRLVDGENMKREDIAAAISILVGFLTALPLQDESSGNMNPQDEHKVNCST